MDGSFEGVHTKAKLLFEGLNSGSAILSLLSTMARPLLIRTVPIPAQGLKHHRLALL